MAKFTLDNSVQILQNISKFELIFFYMIIKVENSEEWDILINPDFYSKVINLVYKFK